MASPELWAPYVRIRTPRVLLPFVVQDFTVHLQEGMHPLAQITVRYHLPETFQPIIRELPPGLWWPEDTAVEIIYGPRRAVARSFVGYVVSPELLDNSGSREMSIPGQMLDVRYTLLGASKRLQTARDRAWRSCTASYMATQIAEEAGLLAVVSPHTRVFDLRQQTLQSDFAFLQDRAREIGWRLLVDGTTLYFTDPRQPLDPRAPVFRQTANAGAQSTLLSFSATVGETDPTGAIRARHEAVSLSGTGLLSAARADAPHGASNTQTMLKPQISRYDQQHVAQSWEEASRITQAAASRDLWWVAAEAMVDGDADLGPGRLVSLGGDGLTTQYRGEWMTRSARHRITLSHVHERASEYYVDLQLGRDQANGLTKTRAPVVPEASSALIRGRWVTRRRAL